MSQTIFYVIPEDIEEPHVTQEVEETAMQEHEGKKGEHLLAEGKIQCDLWVSIPGRDKSVEIDEFIESLSLH